MADFQTTNVAAAITPYQGTSLADILNQAGGVLGLAKGAATFKPSVERAEAEAETAKTLSQSSAMELARKTQDAITASYISRINSPEIIAAEANPNAVDRNKLASSIAQWGIRQGKELGIPEDKALQLTQPYIDIAMNDPGKLRSYLKERHIAGLDQNARTAAVGMMPELTTIAGQPALYNRATGQITQPEIQGQQGAPMGPQSAPAMQGGAQQGMAQAPAQGMELPYKPRQAGDIRPFGPTEQLDTQQGQDYRNRVVGRAAEIPQAQYNVRKVIEQAKELEKEYGRLAESTATGQAVRTMAGWKGDTRFKELSKDLAIAQMSNMKALGMDLNANKEGRDLQAAASGDITFPPSVLMKIARRVEAENLNIQMQAQGAQKFASRHGDANMKAFQEAWARNSSPEVFQAMNGVRGATKGQDVNAIIAKTLGLPADTASWSAEDKTKASEFRTQYRNIQRLTNTGSL